MQEGREAQENGEKLETSGAGGLLGGGSGILLAAVLVLLHHLCLGMHQAVSEAASHLRRLPTASRPHLTASQTTHFC